MADDHQTAVHGENWFSGLSSSYWATPNSMGSFRWNESVTSCKETGSMLDDPVVFQDAQKMEETNSASIDMNSTSKMDRSGLSSMGNYWSEALIRCEGDQSSIQAIPREDSSSASKFQQETVREVSRDQKEWSSGVFVGGKENASTYMFKQIDHTVNLDHPCLNSTVNCQDLQANNLSMISSCFGKSPSTTIQGSFESNFQPQQAVYDDQSINGVNSNEISPQWLKFPQLLSSNTPQQQPTNQLQFSNNTPFWNASAAAMNNVQSSFYPSHPVQLLPHNLEEKPNCCNLTEKQSTEEIHGSGSAMKKGNNEPAFKRPRIEMLSPLPTLKVRKEKLGDRITVLQQLVSPFGKTDTASVLFEVIQCIKFLHEQVHVLSTPYMKNGAILPQKSNDKSKDVEGPKPDLRSRGLCLVPISITFPVANENVADFWTPTYGRTFR